MSPAGDKGARFSRLPKFEGEWITLEVTLSAEHISRLCCFFEGLENTAIVRTPRQGSGIVTVSYFESFEDVVQKALTEMSLYMPLEVTRRHRGLEPLMRAWN